MKKKKNAVRAALEEVQKAEKQVDEDEKLKE